MVKVYDNGVMIAWFTSRELAKAWKFEDYPARRNLLYWEE